MLLVVGNSKIQKALRSPLVVIVIKAVLCTGLDSNSIMSLVKLGRNRKLSEVEGSVLRDDHRVEVRDSIQRASTPPRMQHVS